ncbi:SpaH/EbpB family LPXTG-anchored major pilin [Streptococcus equinus]|uniref:LPXTG-motif cell wall anchor domain protein n=1 Tax=Streptococcus equinus ATCC 9812 TaxID=525379 RepID=E8JMV8_STREI|nr:SpaH/EbpB family LPXTG-anchored major pilin [Streptococcus equinus]EFW89399.1 LPXTG-motif cell wall anchor domain protein [Streptococcus equinus ATCC 9812]SUN56762.1 cell wall surface anchor family protein [Streptococcus equinus]
MKKITQLLFTTFAALSLVFSALGSVTAFAQDNAPGTDDKYDVVLTKVKMPNLDGWPNQTGKDGTVYTGQELNIGAYFETTETVQGAYFEVHKGSVDGEIIEDGLTDADGNITFTNLAAGKYFIVENKEKSEVSGNEELANSAAVPLEIELPVFKADGGWYTTGEDAVHVYPKNTVDKPTIDKVVNEKDKHGTALIGETKTFKVSSVMPEGIADYKVLKFDDEFSKGLSYQGNLKVQLNDADIDTNNYTLTAPSVGTKNAKITVAFTKAYIATLKAGDEITISYDATINEDAVLGAENPNDVKVVYGTNPSKQKEDTPENPELHTGGKRFEKVDKATSKKLSDAEFVVTNEAGDRYLKQTVSNDAVIKNEWISSKDDATVFKSDESGYFEVIGLPYGDADQAAEYGETTYKIVETKAPKDYALLQQPIEFVVNSSSYYEDPTAVVLKKSDSQEVKNNKVTIPQTGGIGSIIVVAVGVVLAVVGLFVKRRVTK